MEYLVAMTTHVPDAAPEGPAVAACPRSRRAGVPHHLRADSPGRRRPGGRRGRAAEKRRTRELADQGYLVRLWTLPGRGRALGLWQAECDGDLQAVLAALPLGPWLEIGTTPLTPHPNDPAGADLAAARRRPAD